MNTICISILALFPGPAQLSIACSTVLHRLQYGTASDGVRYCKRRKAGWGLGTRLSVYYCL